MERAGPRRTTFEGARLRRVAPGLARAALWLALVCGVVPFLPELLAPRAHSGAASSVSPALLAATRDAAAYWLAGAGACLLAAWLAARGITAPVTVALDSRCLYIATPRIERRIPRWMIDDAAARPPTRREAVLQISTGQVYFIVFKAAAQARRLVDAVRPAAAGEGRAQSRRAS